MATRRFILALAAGLAGAGIGIVAAGPQETVPDRPAPGSVAEALAAGRFKDAEQMLRSKLTNPDGPVVDEAAVQLEIIRRTRQEYPLTPEAMLEKLRRDLPGATADDVERWRKEGVLQHRVIDGEIRYFRREPSNLFRFCADAKARRRPTTEPAADQLPLAKLVADLRKAATAAPGPEIYPMRQTVTYQVKVHDGHPRLKPGAKVRCWLPFPQEYRQQKDVRLIATQPPSTSVAPNGTAQRTVYFEQTLGEPASAPSFQAQFEFTTYAYVPRFDPEKVKPYDREGALFRDNTAERPPHIVFTPEIRRIVGEVAGDESNALRRAEKLYRWVCKNVRYCSELEYCVIPNISAKALTTRQGDCGVQALLFITLCRAAEIPARWQSGWETLPGRWNMHDWAEFYVEPWGWLPADPSYGQDSSGESSVPDFYFGHLDPYRLIVNLDYARELVPPKTSFRSEPNDFQRGEIEIDGHNLYFDEWDWTFEAKAVALEAGPAATTQPGKAAP
jgi:transglutaminase-like putative cysteine protease